MSWLYICWRSSRQAYAAVNQPKEKLFEAIAAESIKKMDRLRTQPELALVFPKDSCVATSLWHEATDYGSDTMVQTFQSRFQDAHACTAMFESSILQGQILSVGCPWELPVFCRISPLKDNILIEWSPYTCRILVR